MNFRQAGPRKAIFEAYGLSVGNLSHPSALAATNPAYVEDQPCALRVGVRDTDLVTTGAW